MRFQVESKEAWKLARYCGLSLASEDCGEYVPPDLAERE
jgi:hypothetical protein